MQTLKGIIMTYLLKVEDFVNIEENKSSFVINDMVAICKRSNNPNRDYLFVNKYQAKHYPVKAHNTLQLFSELYQEIKRQIPSDKRILVVGFSETATGIAQAIMHMALENKDLNTVFYLQTTRESINTDIQNISFEEEHSHASTQKLYYRSDIPDYDTVLFIEDEITTGNTIVNFIEKFQKIKDNISFAAASILNWQNTKNRRIFQEKGIKRIYLVSGQMKDNTPLIELKETTLEKPKLTSDVHYHLSDNLNPRTGLTKEEFLVFQETALNRLTSQVSRKSKKETIAVIGTEENMWLPIRLAQELDAEVRSTTRSPISLSSEDNYLFHNGLALASAYETNRVTFLYDIERHYDQIIIVYEVMTDAFRATLQNKLQPFSKQTLIFVKQ